MIGTFRAAFLGPRAFTTPFVVVLALAFLSPSSDTTREALTPPIRHMARVAAHSDVGVSGLTGFQPIDNGTVWRTIGGLEIRANGGSILKMGGTFYWYGMLYNGYVADHAFHGTMKLMLYSSTDLSHWRFLRSIISYNTDQPPQTDPNVTWLGRPDVLYDSATATYVLTMERSTGNRNELAFYTTTSPTGDFTWQPSNEIRFPDGTHTMGDKGVFQDSDGTAYLLFVSDDGAPQYNNTNVKIAAFTDDYLGLSGVISNCGGRGHEAPSMVKRQGSYYLFSSRTNAWRPSATTYKRAASLSGFACTGGDDGNGWSLVGTTPYSADSYSTQHDFVLPVRGSTSVTFVYAGDRWGQFDPTIAGVGRNGWYPLTFDAQGRPLLHGYQHWAINAATGQWQPRT
jgi:hypothetical protein